MALFHFAEMSIAVGNTLRASKQCVRVPAQWTRHLSEHRLPLKKRKRSIEASTVEELESEPQPAMVTLRSDDTRNKLRSASKVADRALPSAPKRKKKQKPSVQAPLMAPAEPAGKDVAPVAPAEPAGKDVEEVSLTPPEAQLPEVIPFPRLLKLEWSKSNNTAPNGDDCTWYPV